MVKLVNKLKEDSIFFSQKKNHLLFKSLEIALMVEGVVLQHPPMSLAPRSRHFVANISNSSSPKHCDGCQISPKNQKRFISSTLMQ